MKSVIATFTVDVDVEDDASQQQIEDDVRYVMLNLLQSGAEIQIKIEDEIVFSIEGLFQLSDGTWGNPGCDVCGQEDAVVKINGKYLCKTSMY